MLSLRSKVALVTGGAAGIGKAIAARLAIEGASVIVTDIRRDLEATASEKPLAFLPHDVSNETEWQRVIREVEEEYGRLDILVNNAGILGPTVAATPESTRLEDWRRIFAVNVEGVFLGCRTALPAMRRAGGGSIVNISSVASLMATPEGMAYGASKAAVEHLTKSVAQYCARQNLNIRCNSIHPGILLTPLWLAHAEDSARVRGTTVDEVITEARSRIPMGDFTRVEDVAGAVLFLACDDSRHITGTRLVIDGGLSTGGFARGPGAR